MQLGTGFRRSPSVMVMQGQLAAAQNLQGQNAAQAQDLQQDRVELT